MQIINSPEMMQKTALELRRQGRKIGFVPTMGFLHEGHISLMRIARSEADVVVLSIFVNPRQFGPKEDLEKYPHDLAWDSELCRQNGVDIIFHPSVQDMYPGFATQASPRREGSAEASSSDSTVFIEENDLSKQLCGASRPDHFSGVLTVVGKLFNLVLPDVAVFGQKDAQQAVLVRHMINDLDFPVRMIIAPIIREHDGLAMSSRNVYLSPDERRDAVCLSAALKLARRLYRSGERDYTVLKGAMSDLIAKVKHPAARVSAEPTGKAGSRGATCSAVVALGLLRRSKAPGCEGRTTQVESLRNPAKPGTPFLPVASHRAFWRRRVKSAQIDYIEIVGAHNLKPMHKIGNEDILIALAVRIGKTRLIDNLPLPDDRLGNLPDE